MSRRRVRAQALIWLVAALPMFVSIAGLAIDGGLLLASRRHLQSVADGAARAGATRLDLERLRASGGSDVQLDASAAVRAARASIDDGLRPLDGATVTPVAEVDVTARRVHVAIQSSLRTAFLRVVNIDTVPVVATAQADVQYGIRGPSANP